MWVRDSRGPPQRDVACGATGADHLPCNLTLASIGNVTSHTSPLYCTRQKASLDASCRWAP